MGHYEHNEIEIEVDGVYAGGHYLEKIAKKDFEWFCKHTSGDVVAKLEEKDKVYILARRPAVNE